MLKKAESKSNDSGGGKDNKRPSFSLSPIQNQVIILMLNIFTTVFIAAGIIMFIDNVVPQSFSSNMRFVDAIYYMIITSGTIGYGDYFPINTTSRMTIIIIIVMIISVFGNQISALAAIIKEADFYDTQYNLKGHIIVLGTQKISILTKFLLNFYKSQINNNNIPQCIIIGETRISPKMKRILSFTLFEDRVHYLSVKNIDQQALKKGCFYDAAAIFYLSDQFSDSPDSSDKKALFINQFLMNNNIRCNLYIQLCITEQPSFMRMQAIEISLEKQKEIRARILKLHGLSGFAENINNEFQRHQLQNIISINLVKTKFQILAFSLFNEGAIQLFSNWFLNDHELLDESQFKSSRQKEQFSSLIETSSIYQQQLDYKLFLIDFPICFVGRSFREAMKIVNNINHCYQGNYIVKCILIGIKRVSEFPKQTVYNQHGNETDHQLLDSEGVEQEEMSQWHINQTLPNFNCGSNYYIINSPDSNICYNDQAIILSSCDDVNRFFSAKMVDQILRYEHRDPVKEYYDKKRKNLIKDKRRSSINLSRILPQGESSQLKRSQTFLSSTNNLQQTTNFENQPSHRLLISESDKNDHEENYASRQISIKANHQNNLNVISSPKHNYQQRSSVKNNNNATPQNTTQHEEGNSTFESISDEFDDNLENDSDEDLCLGGITSNTSAQRSQKRSQGDDLFKVIKNASKVAFYKKLEQNKEEKCNHFIKQSLKHQIRKMFDYRCSVDFDDDENEVKLYDLSTTDVKKKLGNHIIIHGVQKSGVQFFFEEVRKMSEVPLCMYSQSEELEMEFNRMTAKFSNIYFLRGDILNIRHMENANVKQAQAIVVLSERTVEQPFGDSKSIIITQFIKSLYPQKRIITEILDISRLGLLEQSIKEEIRNEKNLSYSYFLSRELMSGRIFFSQQIDVMASMRSTEPHLTTVFLKIIGQQTEIQNYNEEQAKVDKQKQSKLKKEDVNEKSNLLSLRVPDFIDGQDYWEFFEDMNNYKGFILLGIYTQNFNSKEQNENIKIYEELKAQYENEIHKQNKFSGNNETHGRSKSKFFQSKATRKISEEEQWFNIDPSAISNKLPLLILNPPMGTRLQAGDTILALGQIDQSFLSSHLQQKGYQKVQNNKK